MCTFAGELYGLDYICKESENNSGFREVRLSNVRFFSCGRSKEPCGWASVFFAVAFGCVCDEAAGVFAQLRVIFLKADSIVGRKSQCDS